MCSSQLPGQMVCILPIKVIPPGSVRTVLSVIVHVMVEDLVIFHMLFLTPLEVSGVFIALLL